MLLTGCDKMVSKVRTRIGNGKGSEEVMVAPLKGGSRKERADARKRSSPNTNLGRVVVSDLRDKVVSKDTKKKVVSKVKKNAKGKKKSEKDLIWDSGLKVVYPPILIDVPQSLVDVMRSIDNTVAGSVEFSIYVKADTSDIECIRISEDFYIPKQLVSGASVDYNEPPMGGFNAVIHKHPKGVRSFSGTDDDYINQNFTVSILWCDGEFVDATVNYDAGAGIKLQLEGYIYVDDISVLPDIDVSNISVRKQESYAKPVGHGMQSFAEAYGYYSGAGELDDNGVPCEGDDIGNEWNNFSTSTRQEMLRCGME